MALDTGLPVVRAQGAAVALVAIVVDPELDARSGCVAGADTRTGLSARLSDAHMFPSLHHIFWCLVLRHVKLTNAVSRDFGISRCLGRRTSYPLSQCRNCTNRLRGFFRRRLTRRALPSLWLIFRWSRERSCQVSPQLVDVDVAFARRSEGNVVLPEEAQDIRLLLLQILVLPVQLLGFRGQLFRPRLRGWRESACVNVTPPERMFPYKSTFLPARGRGSGAGSVSLKTFFDDCS